MEESVFDPSFGGTLPDTEEMRAFLPDNAYQEESVFDPSFGGSLPDTWEMRAFTPNTPEYYLSNIGQGIADFGGGIKNLLTSLQGRPAIPGGKQGPDYLKYILALLAARKAMKDRPRPSGGGTTMAYQGPKSLERYVTTGPSGQPIMAYGRYAEGGPVKMEDGGFVMTKKAVDGAGGPQGLRSLMPEASMIRGPGTGTSDSIPAYIQGPNGRTPARVSNGEAYVPPGRDTRGLYALMKSLERKA